MQNTYPVNGGLSRPTDTSDYPDHHTFYAFPTGSDVPHHISQILEEVSSGASRHLTKTFEDLLVSIHKASREDVDSESDGEDYEAYDQDDMIRNTGRIIPSSLLTSRLQRCYLFVHTGDTCSQ